MSYAGNTFQIPFSQGGLVANPNIDTNPPTAMVLARNINLHRGGRGRRGGTSHVGSAMSGTPRVMGAYDLTLTNGTQFIMRGTTDGKIWKDASTTIKTGLTTDKVFQFVTFNNKAYICNGADRPQTWDGAAGSTSNLTNVPSDWTGSNWPQQIVKHGKGASERLWAIACTGNVNSIYASDNGTDDFSDANVLKFTINTGDGTGIVGGVEFGDRLIVFSKRKAYVIEDTDTTVANWGYGAAQWEGGVASHRLIVKTPNDVVCMMEDGEIYSLSAVQDYGDYRAASLSRPAFIHEWIRENVNLAYIADFHAVYDPVIRAIKFFMVRAGQTQADTALVYFIDRGPTDGWVVHDNQTNVSGYSASCSALIRVGTGDWQVYTGDYSGQMWKLETSNFNDNSNAYYSGFKTPTMYLDASRTTKMFKRGWLTTQTSGSWNLSINTWIDDSALGTQTISLVGTGAALGSFVLDTDVLGGASLIDKPWAIGSKGKRIQFEFYNANANEGFFLSAANVDFKPLSNRPS